MTKYEPITFTKLSEAIAYVEDGGELYQLSDALPCDDNSDFYLIVSITDLVSMFGGGKCTNSIFTPKATLPWYEKLDGTVGGGVLCYVSDAEDVPCREYGCQIDLVFSCETGGHHFTALTNRFKNATPLTRTEIQKFMDNAPEEV